MKNIFLVGIIIFANMVLQANNFIINKNKNNIFNIKIKFQEIISNDIDFTAVRSIYIDISEINFENIKIKNISYQKYNFIPEEKYIFESSNYIIKGNFEYKGRNFVHIDIPYLKIVSNQLKYLSEIEFEISGVDDSYNAKIEDNFVFINSSKQKIFTKKDPKQENKWFKAGKEYYKLALYYDGIFKLDYNFLQSIGLNPSEINPKYIKVFNKGKEIPLKFIGNNDDYLTSDEFFLFVGYRNYSGDNYRKEAEYGKPYNEYLNRYTDTSIYWLTYDYGSDGLRMESSTSISIYTYEIDFYDELVHDETNIWFDFPYDVQIRREFPEWNENKTWTLGWGASPNLNINNLISNKIAKCYWKVLSRSATTIINAHQVGIKVNNSDYVATATFDRYKHKVVEGEFNSNLLKNGSNSFTLNVLNGTGIFHDWFELEYPRKLVLQDTIIFSFRNNAIYNQNYKIKILKNTSNNFVLIKNNPQNNETYFIDNYTLIQDTIIFNDTIKEKINYFCYDVNKIKNPKFLYRKQFNNFITDKNQADYILLTHKNFLQATNNYLNYIESYYNVNSLLVNIEDVYDYYNYGYFAPEPIKEFLKDVYQKFNLPKPEYLFIVGDATYDYYNNRSKYGGAPKQINWVPSYGSPVSDIWFVCWDTTGAYIPQMKVGRLPVNSVTEFENYFQRLKNYNSKGYDKWNKSFILFSGGSTTSNQYLDIKNINNNVASTYIKPYGGFYEHFCKTVNPNTNFGTHVTQNYFENVIENSALFISYIGHSAISTWDNGIYDITQLNSKKNLYPIIIDFGCSTGKFGEPDILSFSEIATCKINAKAIAYIGNSSLGYTSTAYTAPNFWFNLNIGNPGKSIGEMHLLTKNSIVNTYSNSGSYLLYKLTNLLVGDPIVQVKLPEKANLSIQAKDIIIPKSEISVQDDTLYFKAFYYNFGKPINDTVNIKIIHKNQDFSKTILLQRAIPASIDSIYFPINVSNSSGANSIEVLVNYDNKIDEYNYSDNSAKITFIVKSSSVLTIPELKNNASVNQIKILRSNNDIKTIEISDDKYFYNINQFDINKDSVVTKINLNEFLNGTRYWYAVKDSKNEIIGEGTFIKEENGIIFNDSISYSIMNLTNLIYNKILVLDTVKVKIELISGGYNDGNTAFILYNGTQMISENSVRGHHVYIFERKTLKPIWGRRFDTFNSSDVSAYQNFLDTLSDKFYLAVVIKDEGSTNLNSTIRNLLKQFGSKYADQISFRASWSMLGYKGAPVGSIPEVYSPQYQGIAMCDTTFKQVNVYGNFLVDNIDKYAEKIIIKDTNNTGNITYGLLLENKAKIDTLSNLSFTQLGGYKVIDLSDYNIHNFEKVKLFGEIRNVENVVTGVEKIHIKHKDKAELVVDDKSIVLDKDSVYQSKDLRAQINIYNVGNVNIDSLIVLYYIKTNNNEYQKIAKKIIKEFLANSVFVDNIEINTSYLEGNNSFIVFVDSANSINEYYKFNNQTEKFFYVQKDTGKPVVSINIDNNPTANIFVYNEGKLLKSSNGGNYISGNPLIIIKLNDDTQIPLSDTSHISITMNKKRVNYYNNSKIKIKYNTKNPLMKVYYAPELTDGDYELTVIGKDFNGNYSEPVTKTFKVKNSLEVMEVYNYPNPFKDDTYFTFIATQIPDELRISIYTVAGRKIKEIKKNKNELNYDYNVIYWNGKDEDNNRIANGVYFYKLEVKHKDKKIIKLGKIAKVK
ncbi:MAG TPA: C25 family cysteine peptidase [Ignavibacteriales bacterium]|nr:C25 family cysteine peptidase [Ignavibacteriales bacterium]HOL80249.1 C25 family cysteine peptidase [Ignavibacteriales bacterium]HPP32438.1 C25 family cysteine peptidase [Ignavibacteriales bacterium]